MKLKDECMSKRGGSDKGYRSPSMKSGEQGEDLAQLPVVQDRECGRLALRAKGPLDDMVFFENEVQV